MNLSLSTSCSLARKTIFHVFSYHVSFLERRISSPQSNLQCQTMSARLRCWFFQQFNEEFLRDRRQTCCLCSHVCSMLSSKRLLSSWVCRCSCEWFMCSCRGCVEGVTLPWASNLPIPFSVFFTFHDSHMVSGASDTASVFGLCPATA